mgnify:CR=1 FL=1
MADGARGGRDEVGLHSIQLCMAGGGLHAHRMPLGEGKRQQRCAGVTFGGIWGGGMACGVCMQGGRGVRVKVTTCTQRVPSTSGLQRSYEMPRQLGDKWRQPRAWPPSAAHSSWVRKARGFKGGWVMHHCTAASALGASGLNASSSSSSTPAASRARSATSWRP